MNWVFNWDLWNAVRWSDMGPFQMDRSALVAEPAAGALAGRVLRRGRGDVPRRGATPTRCASSTACARGALWGPRCAWRRSRSLPRCWRRRLGVMVARGERVGRGEEEGARLLEAEPRDLEGRACSPRSSTSTSKLDARSREEPLRHRGTVHAVQPARRPAQAVRPDRRLPLDRRQLDDEREGVQAREPHVAVRVHAGDADGARRHGRRRVLVRRRLSRRELEERRRRRWSSSSRRASC